MAEHLGRGGSRFLLALIDATALHVAATAFIAQAAVTAGIAGG